jgi:transposase
MIVIIWHILSTDTATYQDLGADYFDRRSDGQTRQRYLIRELEKLGNQVTVTPAA